MLRSRHFFRHQDRPYRLMSYFDVICIIRHNMNKSLSMVTLVIELLYFSSALLLVVHWSERWCASLAAQVRLETAITRGNPIMLLPPTTFSVLHASDVHQNMVEKHILNRDDIFLLQTYKSHILKIIIMIINISQVLLLHLLCSYQKQQLKWQYINRKQYILYKVLCHVHDLRPPNLC